MSAESRFLADRRQRILAFFDDGVWDIFVGSWLLMAGCLILVDLVYLSGIWVVLFWPMAWNLKRRVTAPRLSRSQLQRVRAGSFQRALNRLVIGGMLVLLLGLILFVLLSRDSAAASFIRQLGLAPIVAVTSAVFLYAAYLYKVTRWYGYAGLVVLAAIVGGWLNLTMPVVTILLGITILLVGLVVMWRFVHYYPKRPTGQGIG